MQAHSGHCRGNVLFEHSLLSRIHINIYILLSAVDDQEGFLIFDKKNFIWFLPLL